MGGAACSTQKQKQDQVLHPQPRQQPGFQAPRPNQYAPPPYPGGGYPPPPPPPPPPPGYYNPMNSKITVMQNDIGIRKNSIKMEGLHVSFSFDALSPVILSLYYFAKEEQEFFTEITVKISGESFKEEQKYQNPNQNISFKSDREIDLQSLDSQMLVNTGDFWPLIIQLERINPYQKKILFVYCIFEKHGEEYYVRNIKRKLDFNKQSFEIGQIYGINNSGLVNNNVENQANMDDTDQDCVVCICDKIDTIIMPCRHMCVCYECAKSLQNQKKNQKECPICRKSIESFLRIQKDEQQNSAAPAVVPQPPAPLLQAAPPSAPPE